MAIIKYAPGVTPITKEHSGFTFQSSRAANAMMKSQANDRARNKNQNNKKLFLIHATNHWRTLTPAIKLSWSRFAATYPQPTKRNPLKFLTGYQNFIKRASYLFLNYGIQSIFDEPPLMQSLTLDPVTFSIDQSENCIDCSSAYIENFGMLPKAGDYLLLKVLPLAIGSGQYFEPITETIKCNAVYIDGLFLSLHFPTFREAIVYSIFLSKPVNQSVTYTGTKCRYMGCFTSKKFIDLSDTPKTYVGQAGKIPKVKGDETGLEFVAAPSGGITCADLPNCPKIISMDLTTSQINALLIALGYINQNGLGIGLGALYNWFAFSNYYFAPIGWHTPTGSEFSTVVTNLGGTSVSGGKMKSTGTTYFSNPNTGATNSSGWNGKGSGIRNTAGDFSGLLSVEQFGCIDIVYGLYPQLLKLAYNLASADLTSTYKTYGFSIRLLKNDSIDPGFLIDYDGNVYNTLKIGSQVWISSNWKCTHLNNGTLIPNVTDRTAWSILTTMALCYQNNNIIYR